MLNSRFFHRSSDRTDIATSCVSYLEEQLSHQLRAATARLSISDVEDDDRDTAWAETAGNDDDDDEYDSDHLSTDWEAVSFRHFKFRTSADSFLTFSWSWKYEVLNWPFLLAYGI